MPEPLPVSPELITALADALRAAAVQPEGLDYAEAGTLIGLSRTKVYDLDRRGLIPSPVAIGDSGIKRFLRTELLQWMKHGCPSRATWRQVREQAMRRAG